MMKSDLKPECKAGLYFLKSPPVLALLSGVLIGTSYIPFPPWAVFFCYVPLWLFALKAKKLSNLLAAGFVCQSAVTLIGFNWVFYAVREMEFSFIPSCGLFFVFVLISNLHIPLSLALWWFIKNPSGFKWGQFFCNVSPLEEKSYKPSNPAGTKLSSGLLLPVLLGLCTEYYPMIFEWHLGYTFFYAKWPVFQTAEIWGFKFLNTFILFSNLIFLHIYLKIRQFDFLFVCKVLSGEGPRYSVLNKLKALHTKLTTGRTLSWATKLQNPLKLFLSWFACFALLNVYGLYLKSRLPEPDIKISALIIQPAVENRQQDKKQFNNFILSTILQETSKHFYPQNTPTKDQSAGNRMTKNDEQKNLSKKPDFILWPEGAYPYPVNYLLAKKNQDPVQKWARVFGAPLIVSAKGENTLSLSEHGGIHPAPADKTEKSKSLSEHGGTHLTKSLNFKSDHKSYTLKDKGQTKKHYTNSVFVFDKNGKLISPPYNKTRLLPFGEYMPGGFAFLNRLRFGEERAFKKGTGPYKVISLKPPSLSKEQKYKSSNHTAQKRLKPPSLSKEQQSLPRGKGALSNDFTVKEQSINLGFQICYEGLFDYLTRESVQKGADLLINVSNDAWFGTWQEPYQHLYMTLSRAVEVRRPLVRGTNSGFSAVVSAKGEITGPYRHGRYKGLKEVSLYSRKTKALSFFMSYGYYINQAFLWLCLLIILLYGSASFSRKGGRLTFG